MPVSPRRVPATRRFQLANGLTVVLAPEKESPTVSVWVWYRVGAKNEVPGITGASHWVEHMLFLGSPRYRKGEMDRAVLAAGGTFNAFTSNDFTAYFSTVPRERLSIPLDIESDRMTRALIAPREVQRERTIVLSEREGNENWPEFRVDEELHAVAFQRHPYRWDALGYPEDIRSMSAETLSAYYHRFYGPKNATLVVAGGFDLTATEREVRRRFGRLPRAGDDPRVTLVEPPPTGPRRSALSGPGTTPFLEVGWRAPSIRDPTAPAAILLDVVLGGESRLFATGSIWGRSSEHPSSRLYRRLVDPGLAVHATSEWQPRVHPGLFTVAAQAASGVPLARVETALLAEVDRLRRSGPSAREVREARRKISEASALCYEGATRTGFRLGFFEVLSGPRFEAGLLRSVLRTSPRQVHAAAKSIFQEEGRTLVTYEPQGDPHGE